MHLCLYIRSDHYENKVVKPVLCHPCQLLYLCMFLLLECMCICLYVSIFFCCNVGVFVCLFLCSTVGIYVYLFVCFYTLLL